MSNTAAFVSDSIRKALFNWISSGDRNIGRSVDNWGILPEPGFFFFVLSNISFLFFPDRWLTFARVTRDVHSPPHTLIVIHVGAI